MCVRDGLTIVAAAFRIFPEILSRPVALELDNPLKSLATLVTGNNLKPVILVTAGLIYCSKVKSEFCIKLARLGTILIKYSLKASDISSGKLMVTSLIFNSFTTERVADRPNRLLIVFQASLGLFL